MKQGITRIVFLIGGYAIKIPNTRNGHVCFLRGCINNWEERRYCKNFKKCNYEVNMIDHVAPSYFCSWFGLIQVQKRCEPYHCDLTESQKEFFRPMCGSDNKKENFGILDGKIVCLDYNY